MIFVYLYLGGFIAKSVLKFNWLSIPWTQIAPIFSAISALAACASVIVSIHMANKNRKFSEENNKNNLEAAKRNSEISLEVAKRNNDINVAAARQNNFDNLFFKLIDLLDTRINSISRIDGEKFDASVLVSQIKDGIREQENKKAYSNQLDYIRANYTVLVDKLISLENLELSRTEQNGGKNYAMPSTQGAINSVQIKNETELEECLKKSKISPTWAEVIYAGIKYVKSGDFNYEDPIAPISKTGMIFSSVVHDEEDLTIKNELDSFLDVFNRIMSETKITSDDIKNIVQNSFGPVQFGSFFSIVNRIAKIIKEEYENNIEEQNKYIGILRTQIPSLLLVCIYLNAEYMSEGEKLQENLKNLELWGDKEELKNNIHINATMFYSAGDEIENIIKKYTRK
ncbi:putative phage abortive infection protein [Pediococcus pentosaceus]|uniref:putative phage abortive infection protein n=1 Tax=Pediococcus pentosaceus TaxID=1255 RepID=UPI003AF36A48